MPCTNGLVDTAAMPTQSSYGLRNEANHSIRRYNMLMQTIPFNGKGSSEEIEYDIVVEMSKGQHFCVKTVSDKLLQHALKRVAKHFPGKPCHIKKRVTMTYHYETESFELVDPSTYTIYEDNDDNGPSYTVVKGSSGSIGQYLYDDPKIQQLISLGVKIKPGIDNRTNS
jgi:hypothetical protein